MEELVYRNNLYNLTKFIRKLPNAYKILQEFSTQVGIEHEQLLHELFDELYTKRLSKLKIKDFLDICAAPGVYSQYLLQMYPEAHGTGISLSPEEGGHIFKIENDRYNKIYQNIFNISTESGQPSYNLCMASCIPYYLSAKTDDEFSIIFKSLSICLNFLKKNGTLIINFSFKNIIFAVNFVYLLSLLFRNIRLFKSTKFWIMQRTFYVVGYQYMPNTKIITRIVDYEKKFNDFYNEYQKKLFPEIGKKNLEKIMQLFESDVFIPQLKTYMFYSIKCEQ